MTNRQLSKGLDTMARAMEGIVEQERDEAGDLEHRTAREDAAIADLFRSIETAVADGKWRNTRSNIFNVLGRPRLEGAHSSFLAWLFNPDESHGLEDRFLRRFMLSAIHEEPPSTTDVRIYPEFTCEAGRFDIYVEGPGWCLLVENKIDDEAWEEQLRRYKKYCEQVSARGRKSWLVYVTRGHRRPSKLIPHWISYGDVSRILESLDPDPAASLIIEHFRDHIATELES